MEKRLFNKIIKREMLAHGFDKTGSSEYAKEAKDGIAKIIVRTPEYNGFIVGAQFKDFGKYTGKISDACMKYREYSLLLCSPSTRDYSVDEIVDAVMTLVSGISVYLERGKSAIQEKIDLWDLGIGEKEQNRIYSYFGLPLWEPYSEAYMLKQIEEVLQQGGSSMMSLEEYYAHKEYYDNYKQHGCSIIIRDKFVIISYDRYPRKFD